MNNLRKAIEDSERITNALQPNSQPEPQSSDHPDVMSLLLADLDARYQHGLREYGTPLRPFNGRHALQDAYEEVLDLALYLRQAIYEAENV